MKIQLELEHLSSDGQIKAIEILHHLGYMTWQDQKRVVDFCREITKPMREAASRRYAEKRGDII